MVQLPVGQVQSVSKPVLDRRFFVRLLLFLIIFLAGIVIAFVYFSDYKSSKNDAEAFVDKFKNETAKFVSPGQPINSRYLENFDNVKVENDKNKQFELLAKNFEILKGYYVASHDSSIRSYLSEFSGFVESKFKNQYEDQVSKFSIPCLESSCQQISYPPEVDEIRKLVSDAKFHDEIIKKQILVDLESAQFAQKNEEKYSIYSSAYQGITSELKVNKDLKLESASEKMLKLLNKVYENH